MALAIKSERGSALVESLISAPLLGLMITGIITASYIGFVHVWVRHASYEAAICLASFETSQNCRKHLENTINGALIGKPLRNAQLHRYARRANVSFEVTLLGKRSVREMRSLTLPLREKKGSFDELF